MISELHHVNVTVPSELELETKNFYRFVLGLPEHKVRVICPYVGGAFGLKHHLYPDELAACATAVLLGRPVKFIADRLESFLSDRYSLWS